MKKYIFLIVIITFVFFNCDKYDTNYAKESPSYTGDDRYEGGNAIDELKSKQYSRDKSEETDKYEVDERKNEPNDDRKVIKTGTINYIVNDFKNLEDSIYNKVKDVKGYVESSSFSKSYGTVVVKIPADSFDVFLKSTETFGKISSKNISVKDVTFQFYDLKSRIETKRILEERYKDYLKKAARIEDLLKIERELNTVIGEIEQMEGSFKNLTNLISYSTLTLTFSIPGTDEFVRNYPSIIKGLKDFGYTVVSFFYVLFFIILSIIAFGVPVVILLAILYYITFGKRGLLKKLFKLLSVKK